MAEASDTQQSHRYSRRPVPHCVRFSHPPRRFRSVESVPRRLLPEVSGCTESVARVIVLRSEKSMFSPFCWFVAANRSGMKERMRYTFILGGNHEQTSQPVNRLVAG